MRNHTKVYLKKIYPESFSGSGDFRSELSDIFMACEKCGRRAVDIHHIDARGMGGSSEKDYIENLMALCRSCHDDIENNPHKRDDYIKFHKTFLEWRLM